MPNALITPGVIAKEVWMQLMERSIMLPLVYRNYQTEFDGKQGDTITVKKNASFVVNDFDRANPSITVQNAVEDSFTLDLDQFKDISFALTTEEMTLEINEISQRFLAPAAVAFSEHIDQAILAALVAGTAQGVGTDGVQPTNPRILIDAGKVLRDNKVPVGSNTVAILTTATGAEFSKDPLMTDADKRGSTAGLIEAAIGRKFKFDCYDSLNLPAGNDSIAFHNSAISFVSRTPAPPISSGVSSYVMGTDGLGLRVVIAYDNNTKRDVVSIDLLYGVKMLDATRSVKILG